MRHYHVHQISCEESLTIQRVVVEWSSPSSWVELEERESSFVAAWKAMGKLSLILLWKSLEMRSSFENPMEHVFTNVWVCRRKYLWWWIRSRWDKSKAVLSTLAQDKGSHHRFAAGTAAHTKLLFSRRCVQIKYAHLAFRFFSCDSTYSLYTRQRRTVFICFRLKRLCSL